MTLTPWRMTLAPPPPPPPPPIPLPPPECWKGETGGFIPVGGGGGGKGGYQNREKRKERGLPRLGFYPAWLQLNYRTVRVEAVSCIQYRLSLQRLPSHQSTIRCRCKDTKFFAI
jgi:hypothetical protein